ncbi:hypothetical protein D3C84_305920 [compost metagenome]
MGSKVLFGSLIVTLDVFPGGRGQRVVAKIKSLAEVAGQIEEGGGQFGDLVVIQNGGSNARVIHQALGNAGNCGTGKIDVVQLRHVFQGRAHTERVFVQVERSQLVQGRQGGATLLCEGHGAVAEDECVELGPLGNGVRQLPQFEVA